jgi:hypothetical protein
MLQHRRLPLALNYTRRLPLVPSLLMCRGAQPLDARKLSMLGRNKSSMSALTPAPLQGLVFDHGRQRVDDESVLDIAGHHPVHRLVHIVGFDHLNV